MAIPSLRIAISGCGTAGPAAAIFLARAGHDVTLFERAAQRLPVGAGFLLQPTGLAVLQRLGLRDELLPHTAEVSKLYCRTTGGRVLLDLSYQELGPGLSGAGTHRATLLEILVRAMQAAGATIHWGTPLEKLTRDSTGRPLLQDAHGHRHGPYDLLLICDGASSSLRAQSGVPARVSRYPWGALWFIGLRTPEFDPHVLWQSVSGTRQLNGYLPTGTRDDLLSLFWSLRLDAIPEWRAQPLEKWKRQVLFLAPQAEAFLQQIESHDQMAAAAYSDVVMRQWHGERVVMLGDAAHALSPQLGQGVNLALMDAAALGDALTEHPLPAALAQYSATRRRHLRFYQFATRWTTPFFQSGLLPLGWLRDLAFPILHTLPYMRRQMTATMAGGKLGPFAQMQLQPSPARLPSSTLTRSGEDQSAPRVRFHCMSTNAQHPSDSPVFDVPAQPIEVLTLGESLEAEFPDIPGEEIRQAIETAQKETSFANDLITLKSRVREIIRR